jgi:hypothetical protein
MFSGNPFFNSSKNQQHVTLFSEDEGPNLAEWNQDEALKYLTDFDLEKTYLLLFLSLIRQWCFLAILFLIHRKTSIDRHRNSAHIYQVTDVILATGHSRNYLSEKEAENQSYAKENNLEAATPFSNEQRNIIKKAQPQSSKNYIAFY